MEAPPKTNRKLRKERKNRAKKVRIPPASHSARKQLTNVVSLSSAVPPRRRLRSPRRRVASRSFTPCLSVVALGLSYSSHRFCIPTPCKSCLATVSYAYAFSLFHLAAMKFYAHAQPPEPPCPNDRHKFHEWCKLAK